MYRSVANCEFDKAELLLYEEVTRMPPFRRKTLVLIGVSGVGRRTLKNRLINSDVDKFGAVIPRKYERYGFPTSRHSILFYFFCPHTKFHNDLTKITTIRPC